MLWSLKGADFLLVQNPPSIPTLGVSRIFVLFFSRRTKLIIDWHNLGYSILALKLGPNHPFVKLYKWYERIFGSHAFCHFTVTIRMGEVLKRKFNMRARRILPLYDRPALDFHPLTFDEKIKVIKRFSGKDEIFKDMLPPTHEKIIITSTSYTPDEDIYMLLKALKLYDKRKLELDLDLDKTEDVLQKSSSSSAIRLSSTSNSKSKPKTTGTKILPKLRVIITGKGPMLPEIQKYIKEISPLLQHVKIYTTWLSTEDYPKVIGTADLGISLHMSSSGWDLPMKAVDMFGCGVPVITLNYPAVSELIQDESNGLYVKDAESISETLERVMLNDTLYDQIKSGAMRESRIKWDHEWGKKVGPLFGIGHYRERADDEYDEDSTTSSDSGF